MPSLDPLMRMIAAQGGTTLQVVAGEAPRLYHGSSPLRFFAPPMTDGLLRDMLRGSIGDAAWQALEAAGTHTSVLEGDKVGAFELDARLEGGRLRLQLQRAATAPEPDPEPSRRRPPEGPAGAPAGAAVDAARGARPRPTGRSVGGRGPARPAASPAASPARLAAVAAEALEVEDAGAALAAADRAPEVATPWGGAPVVVLPAGALGRSLPPPAPPARDLGALTPLLVRALHQGASDLHLGEHEVPVVRIDGRLRPLAGSPPSADLAAELEAALSPEQHAQLQHAGAVDFAIDLADEGRVRGNAYRHAEGLAVALRVLDRAAPALDKLDLSVDLRPLAAFPHGLVLVCGPTGSGKSTTVAALARVALETRGGVLVTLEDPIEFVHRAPSHGRVRQRAVGQHVPDFPTGLRDALREDPDFLLVGEMRDRATIELALTAAETGHLVFSTLHSRTAASAVERIVDALPPERQGQIRTQLAESLRAIVAQRLLPRADGAGRTVALEVLRVTDAVAALIREGRTAQIASALQAGGEQGMVALGRSLAALVRTGRVSRAVAEAAVSDGAALGAYLG